MSLYDIIQNILDVSKNHNLVREVGEGDIYKYLNSSEHQYPCVFLTVSSINDDLNSRNVNCTLFYVDRLTSDESNKILVQSLGLSVLSDIVERIAGDIDAVEYTTFTEKFTDLCGGVYASLSIGYPLDGACSNDFEVRELEVTENGVYDVLGYDRIVVGVKGPKPVFKIKNDNVFRTDETEIPFDIDSTDVTSFKNMFGYCDNLTTIPQIDTSNGTSFIEMFISCDNLTTIPLLDTSNGTNFNYMFQDCASLTTIPQLDTSNGTSFANMFNDCDSLITIPLLDTSNGTSFGAMFAYCDNLTTIPQLDISNGTSLSWMFNYCYKLENITFIGSINASIEFQHCRKLTYESVKSILTACSNTTNTNSKTLKFSRTLTDQNGELANLITTCTSKGWTISGLTIN